MAYPVIVGVATSAMLVASMRVGGELQYGAWAYVAVVIGAVTFAVDWFLRLALNRWAPAQAMVLVPLAASAFGIVAGWWMVNHTMGGPV